ncbi:cobalamin biosynthesis protein [Natronomonas sp.]|uniref:cobalamin biosynthesis protein n=1 Tax=Natronomonas sp. TaxID=2184060 RepID=UPI00260A72FF|nr:cobalamin biosynthesis protein [Natronomonas sp.]
MSVERETPEHLLDAHPETAYFWGRVIGDGGVTESGVTVRTNDETAAERLAAIAGAETAAIDHDTVEREYAHDASITRREDSYTVQVHGPIGERAAAALGLPFEAASGGYRLDVLAGCDRELLRGIIEGCGTVCFKSSSGTVGISVVHDDRKLLERVQGLIDAADVEAPCGEVSETSSGGYWFGIDDAAAPAFGAWLYADSDATGLFAPSRRRKTERSIEEAGAY